MRVGLPGSTLVPADGKGVANFNSRFADNGCGTAANRTDRFVINAIVDFEASAIGACSPFTLFIQGDGVGFAAIISEDGASVAAIPGSIGGETCSLPDRSVGVCKGWLLPRVGTADADCGPGEGEGEVSESLIESKAACWMSFPLDCFSGNRLFAFSSTLSVRSRKYPPI